jgi:hypothetical protein
VIEYSELRYVHTVAHTHTQAIFTAVMVQCWFTTYTRVRAVSALITKVFIGHFIKCLVRSRKKRLERAGFTSGALVLFRHTRASLHEKYT